MAARMIRIVLLILTVLARRSVSLNRLRASLALIDAQLRMLAFSRTST